MIIIKTDEELRKQKAELEIAMNKLVDIYNGYKKTLDELYITWRAVKDPIVKREIHKEIFKLKDEMMFGRIQMEISCIRCDINEIERILHSTPNPNYGCLYDSYHDFDIDEIMNYGIRGVRL